MHNSRGWSLLETFICIILSASLAWAAIPHLNRSSLRTDAKLLTEILRAVRHRAIVERREYLVSYQTGTCSVNPTQAGLIGLCKYLKVTNPSAIKFYPNGVTSPASLILKNGDEVCVVSIALRGRVRHECNAISEKRRD